MIATSFPGFAPAHDQARGSVAMIIAIDGPAASGKGTLGNCIAAHYGLAHLDTGKLYRAVARDTLAKGGDPSDADAALAAAIALDLKTLADPALIDGQARRGGLPRRPSSRGAGGAARLSAQFRAAKPGAVLDGRDIGTVICPDAEVKLFVTATPEERARRRFLELKRAGMAVSEEDVLADIRRRDERDKGRATAPLARARRRSLARHHEFGYRRRVQGSHRFDRCCDGPCRAGRLRRCPFRIGTPLFDVFRGRASGGRRRPRTGLPPPAFTTLAATEAGDWYDGTASRSLDERAASKHKPSEPRRVRSPSGGVAHRNGAPGRQCHQGHHRRHREGRRGHRRRAQDRRPHPP